MKVVVIGAGASGLIAAATAQKNGHDVIIIEKKNKAGIKLSITGKGRCNVTNNCDVQTLLDNTVSNSRFLYSCFNNFSSKDTLELFNSLNVELKTERGNRVFPVSDNAKDIVNALVKYNCLNQIIYNTSVKSLIIDNNSIKGVKLDNNQIIDCDAVIVCTGGKSYPNTGSSGDGYLLAKQAGHSITELLPSLVPIVCKETFCKDLMGLSLKNIRVTFKQGEKTVYSEQGEMLFTHFGVSGPLILSGSAHVNDISACKIIIDLKPALSNEELDSRLIRDFNKYSNKDFCNALNDLLPQKLINVFIKLTGINPHLKVNQITKENRIIIVDLLKNFELNAKSFRPIDEAIITRGGVNTKEINPKTMQSKLCKGLFFAGEVLDVDAYTGGFNLQIAFSTGYAAGNNI
ncbi:MAG: NAD(P)/FAD-dependent oxidoreductase [Acutalibacteraceae bacterium]|nr:NAD(P)/FAD-dependent oxidoreductase [Acutalibacteraceae bacterium]